MAERKKPDKDEKTAPSDAAHRSEEITELEELAMREARRGTAESLDRALKAVERAAKLRRDSQS
ncbi:hypothetical protein [Streptomyces sp. NPDC037389]|uniref:hypothetical protein n=1 Tax=Streptomyces sp. NPDC037389 TaxID=3155369 RepID=UPI0033ED6E93